MMIDAEMAARSNVAGRVGITTRLAERITCAIPALSRGGVSTTANFTPSRRAGRGRLRFPGLTFNQRRRLGRAQPVPECQASLGISVERDARSVRSARTPK